MNVFRSLIAVTLTSVVALGCATESSHQESSSTNVAAPAEKAVAATQPAAASTPDPLAVASELGISNAATPLPGLLTAGQLTEEQMTALAEAGYVKFVSLRTPGESGAGWEESFASENGIEFVRIPIAGGDGLSEENATLLAGELADVEGSVALYCGSSNRVGALMALKAFHLEAATPEEAYALGKAAGVTSLDAKLKELLGLPAAESH